MYEKFFGLTERPFDISPNPRYLVLTPSHEEALSNVEYGISTRKAITLLLGDAGTGKTTLLRKALGSPGRGGCGGGCVYLNNPTLSRPEFYQALAAGFRLGPESASSKTVLLRELDALLRDRLRHGLTTALIVDEAQSLPDELLEELRLLMNIESDTEKFLPLVLAGQPELAERLNHPNLRQLKQRIALRCCLPPLTLRETAWYIATRIRLAGGDPGLAFTRDAVVAVHEAAGGIPRTISVICDNALLAGFASDEQPVGADTIQEVCADFDLPGVRSRALPDSASDAPAAPVDRPGPRPAAERRLGPVPASRRLSPVPVAPGATR